MRRRTFLGGLAGGAVGAVSPLAFPKALYALAPTQRGVLVVMGRGADPAIAEVAKAIAGASDHPLLKAMSGGQPVKVVESRSVYGGDVHELALNHLILVGTSKDPVIAAAWQREATLDAGSMYAFGFGHLQGDIGYIESDRNPFLHSQEIASTPYETEVVTITGTSPAGIQLAAQAFLKQSLVNGVVAATGWSRPRTSLLDRDPLTPDFTLPALVPERIGNAQKIACTQATEDEYRGVLEDTSMLPRAIWRVKYFEEGNWDSPGAAGSFDNYAAGLHRRSYGNTLWLAQFVDVAEATAAAPKIASAAHLQRAGAQWKGDQPAYANNTYAGEQKSPGSLTLWQAGDWVLMSAMQKRFGQ
jgi:hypothetical protein